MVITLSTDVIPSKAISLLNFSDESLDSSFANGDLVVFLNELYNESSLLLSESGDISVSGEHFRHYITEQKLERGIEESCDFAEQFTKYAVNALPTPAAAETYKLINPEYFFSNVSFGRTLKYLIAWDNLCSNVLAESAFFSQAHLLEARTDIDASVDMAARFYYKQSFQILRGFLENAVLPVHFCNQPNEFDEWRSNNYHTPALRGKNGLLNKLVVLGLITSNLSNDISDLYQQLNGSIHGGEKYLIHKGLHKNSWSGLLFKEQDFLDWCTAVSKAIEVGAKLLQINVKQLMNLRSSGDVVCATCHNDKYLKLEKFMFGGRNFKQYLCAVCGHQSTFDEDGHLSHKVTQYEQ
ncbi:hypothetical protein NLP_4068 [Nostoc sp. 'Lobaria pulmonaria (5183) cyanobiont']|nr:hypothetical protein NLP_4068 [Nostoc sp. 'Lobaria pulmonaria (5183) cyanobiont']